MVRQKKHPTAQPFFLTIPDVAIQLGVCRTTVYNLINHHGLLLVHQVGLRLPQIVSKKSRGCRCAASCGYRVFCVFSQAAMGHGTSKPSKPCSYKYRSSVIALSVLRLFEGSRATNREPSKYKTPCLNTDIALIGNTFVVPLGLAHWWDGASLKITNQAPKGHLIGIVLFPLGKVPNVPLSSNSGCPRIGCILDGFIQRDGEEGSAFPGLVPFSAPC